MPERLSSAPDTPLQVVALCAAWCRTCDAYRPLFSARAAAAVDAGHVWLDVEDDADWIGDLDIETFPTLLVLRGDQPLFFGPVLPHTDVIDRTLAALADARPAALDADVRQALAELAQRLKTLA